MIFQIEVFNVGPIYGITFKLFGIPLIRYERLDTVSGPKHLSGGYTGT